MSNSMLSLYIFIYILMGAFILEIVGNIWQDFAMRCDGAVIGLCLFFWPFVIVVVIFIGIVYGVMSLGAWLGKLIRRIFIERKRSE